MLPPTDKAKEDEGQKEPKYGRNKAKISRNPAKNY
jgi:hypothetical protein